MKQHKYFVAIVGQVKGSDTVFYSSVESTVTCPISSMKDVNELERVYLEQNPAWKWVSVRSWQRFED